MKNKMYEPIGVESVPVPEPYDVKKASRELRRKKRLGEVDHFERLPKKRTLDQLRREYANSTYSEMEDSVRYDVYGDIFYDEPKQTQIERLLELCTSISHMDTHYQNLHSEYDRAVRDAQKILEMATEIKSIIDTTKQEDARLVVSILKIMDICYVRVLGDRVEDVPFDGTDLESWIRSQHWKNERLKELMNRERYVQAIYKYSPR